MMQEPVTEVAFLRNHAGQVCISLSDPTFVHSDSIVINRTTLCVFAVMYADAHYLGAVSQNMADAIGNKDEIVLSSLHPDGTVFELTAPISVRCIEGCCCDAATKERSLSCKN